MARLRDFSAVEFLSVPDMLKATPAMEGGKRVVYLEASNEARDYQGEVILAKALSDSADYYLRYGNVDIDHVTQIGAKVGIPDYPLFEIGRPVSVRAGGAATFVKAEIFTGEGPAAAKANMVWDSMTKIRPPQRWYPSVGGKVIDRVEEYGVDGGKRTIIKSVRWTNIGLSKTPVNLDVPTASTVPFGLLAKSWGPAGLDLAKTLTAGYGTDSAALTGGAALREQSLDGAPQITSYFDFRDRLAGDIRKNKVRAQPHHLIAHARKRYGLDEPDASEWVEKFLADVRRHGRSKRAA